MQRGSQGRCADGLFYPGRTPPPSGTPLHSQRSPVLYGTSPPTATPSPSSTHGGCPPAPSSIAHRKRPGCQPRRELWGWTGCCPGWGQAETGPAGKAGSLGEDRGGSPLGQDHLGKEGGPS